MSQKSKVVEAVNFLIESPNYTRLIKEMTDIIERWDTHPMVYGGQLAILNAVIDVGLENREAFERLIKLMDEKRKLIPTVKRMDYQRDLMRDRRIRANKAIELHELTHGSMTTSQKAQFTKDLQARWRKARDEFIKAKGDLGWAERNAAAGEFWADVDRKLDINLATARRGKR